MHVVVLADAQQQSRPTYRARVSRALQGSTQETIVLNFTDWSEHDIRACADAQHAFEYVAGGQVVDAVAEATHRDLCAFVSEMGQLWQREMPAPQAHEWWYNAVSEKNAPAHPEWWMLYRLAALREFCRTRDIRSVTVVGDAVWSSLVRELLPNVQVMGVSGWRQFVSTTHMTMKTLARRLVGLCCASLACLMAKPFRSAQPASTTPDSWGAFTWFPRSWVTRDGVREDRYYGQLMQEPIIPLYRVYDHRAFVPVRVMHKRYQQLRTTLKTQPGYVLDAHMRLLDVWRSYCFGSAWRRVHRVRAKHLQACADDVWASVTAQLLWRLALRSYAVELPMMRIQESAVKRLAQCALLARYIVYCFEFIYGRAIIQGLRAAGAKCIVGMQHGPMTPMKMLYSGLPNEMQSEDFVASLPNADEYFVDSAFAAQLLQVRGVEAAHIHEVGALRLDRFFTEQTRLTANERSSGGLTVLVAPGLHDTEVVLDQVCTALAGLANVQVIARLHPKVSADAAQQMLEAQVVRASGTLDIRIERTGEIYQWMRRADLFVATYSTVAVEAVHCGVPVVQLMMNGEPDLGAFYGTNVALQRAWDAQSLRSIVQLHAGSGGDLHSYTQQLIPIVGLTFGAQDGRSVARAQQYMQRFS